MFLHVFSSLSDASFAHSLAGRADFLRVRAGTRSVFRIAYTASRGHARRTHARQPALDGADIRNYISGEFDAVQPNDQRHAACIRRPAHSHLSDARAHPDFAIRHHPPHGFTASLNWTNRFCPSRQPSAGAIRCSARLVNTSGERSVFPGIGGYLLNCC